MSFSSEVRAELSSHLPASRHCQIAELAAFFAFCGKIEHSEDGRVALKIQTENGSLAKKCFTLIKKTFNISACVCLRRISGSDNIVYRIMLYDPDTVRLMMGALKLINPVIEQIEMLTSSACCGRSYLCGAFLAAGSVSDPRSSYHFEIVCDLEQTAEAIARMINRLSMDEVLDAKVVPRKKHYIVYVKEGASIVELLGMMGAHKALMDMENHRALKEMRNGINRRVNCETANINKTVSAAVKQIEDIQYIRDNGGFGGLKDVLREMALLRLEYPEASLKELGELTNPPVGKSGVNHRLRRLSEIAEEMRG